ncbi:MAG: hypothetical protein DHS20C02_13590 [Micavibrio sp.]|nr:MAG: hypothetical protein DHS20C02_13590 [Micavibrio sp.]
MKPLFYAILFTFLALTPQSHVVAAQDARAQDVKKVERYLQDLKTARARFVQTTHDGAQFVGTFYLERPGKLRFEYDPPNEDFVVADGFFIYFYDAELGAQTNAPIGQTMADFFLRKELDLEGDVTVKNLERNEEFLMVELAQKEDPEAGSLTLAFKEDPMTLKKWRVVDPQGLITEVELFYLKTGITHPSDLFAYFNPNSGKPSYNE